MTSWMFGQPDPTRQLGLAHGGVRLHFRLPPRSLELVNLVKLARCKNQNLLVATTAVCLTSLCRPGDGTTVANALAKRIMCAGLVVSKMGPACRAPIIKCLKTQEKFYLGAHEYLSWRTLTTYTISIWKCIHSSSVSPKWSVHQKIWMLLAAHMKCSTWSKFKIPLQAENDNVKDIDKTLEGDVIRLCNNGWRKHHIGAIVQTTIEGKERQYIEE